MWIHRAMLRVRVCVFCCLVFFFAFRVLFFFAVWAGCVLLFCCLGGAAFFLLFGRRRVCLLLFGRGACSFFAVRAGERVFPFLLFGRGTGLHSLTGLPGSSSSDPTTKKTKQQKKHGFRHAQARRWYLLVVDCSPLSECHLCNRRGRRRGHHEPGPVVQQNVGSDPP